MYPKLLVITVVSACLLMTELRPGFASWRDNSDDLPGMSSTGTVLLVGLVTAAAVVGIVVLTKSHPDDPEPASGGSAPDSLAAPSTGSTGGGGGSRQGSAGLTRLNESNALLGTLPVGPASRTLGRSPARLPIMVAYDYRQRTARLGISTSF